MLGNQKGLSLIELVIVMTVIMILATVTAPYLLKARQNAENGNAYSSLRSMLSAQFSYYSANRRYARLDELNIESSGALGTTNGNQIIRRPFLFEMSPANPTDAELRENFVIFLYKPGAVGVDAYSKEVDASGIIRDHTP